MPTARNTIREDCHRMGRVTYLEAAHITGLSVKTIRNASTRGALKTFPGTTAYKVDRLSLETWAFDGVDYNPQKVAASRERERQRKSKIRERNRNG